MTCREGHAPAHPPFEPGNAAAVKHGASSPRRVRPLAEQIAATLVDVAPWAAQPTYTATVQAWSWAEAQIQLLRSYLDEVGVLDDEGEPRPASNLLASLERHARALRSDLVLSPAELVRYVRLLQEASSPELEPERKAAMEAGLRLVEARRELSEGRAS